MPTKTNTSVKSAPKVKPITATHITTIENSTIEVTTKTTTKKGYKSPTIKILLETDDIVKDQFGGFIKFLREHAIVGLAVGFIIGQQAQGVIKQLVSSFIDPTIELLIGGVKLSERKVPLHLFGNTAEFGWGAMLYVLLNLLVVLATIYALIKILKLDKLDKPKA